MVFSRPCQRLGEYVCYFGQSLHVHPKAFLGIERYRPQFLGMDGFARFILPECFMLPA